MLKELIHRMQSIINSIKLKVLSQGYSYSVSKRLKDEVLDTLDETFEENKIVMDIFKKRLVKIYKNDIYH